MQNGTQTGALEHNNNTTAREAQGKRLRDSPGVIVMLTCL